MDLELKFGLGKSKNITKDDIENAILKKCSVDKEDIYKVDVRKHYTIVSLHPKCAAQVMEYMNRTKINDKRCEVYPYKKAKDKAPKNKS